MTLEDAPLGAVLTVKRKKGKYTYRGTKETSAGRTVVSLVGPLHTGREAFHACYIEDVKTITVP